MHACKQVYFVHEMTSSKGNHWKCKFRSHAFVQSCPMLSVSLSVKAKSSPYVFTITHWLTKSSFFSHHPFPTLPLSYFSLSFCFLSLAFFQQARDAPKFRSLCMQLTVNESFPRFPWFAPSTVSHIFSKVIFLRNLHRNQGSEILGPGRS